MLKIRKRNNREIFFKLGICFMGVAIVFITNVNRSVGIVFLGLGIVYMIIGGKGMKKK